MRMKSKEYFLIQPEFSGRLKLLESIKKQVEEGRQRVGDKMSPTEISCRRGQ